MIVQPETPGESWRSNVMIAGPRNVDGSGGLSLEEVEEWLAKEET